MQLAGDVALWAISSFVHEVLSPLERCIVIKVFWGDAGQPCGGKRDVAKSET